MRLVLAGPASEALGNACVAEEADRQPETTMRRPLETHQHDHINRADPEPLRRQTPPPKEYPMDALGEVLGPAAETLRRVVQAPDAVCAQSVLAAASLAAQPHANVVIDGRKMPLSLWFLTIAESGERKSAADGLALEEHRKIERDRVEQFQSEIKASAFERETRRFDELNPRDLQRTVADRETPLLPQMIASDPTLEGLQKLLILGRGTVGLFSDEGGQFFGGHAMNRDNHVRSAAALSSLWDRGDGDRIRAGDGAAKYYGKRFSMHILVQPVIAERVLSDSVLSGQGFLGRCLIAWPESRAGYRPYVSCDLSAEPSMVNFWSRMKDLLTRPLKLRNGQRNEIDPPLLELSTAAKCRWVEMYNSIERFQQPGGEYAAIKTWAGKAAENIARVAGVLTIVRDPNARTIERTGIEDAEKLLDFHLDEAVRLCNSAAVPVDILHAEALLNWCRQTNRRAIYSTLVLQFGPNCIRDADRFSAAIRRLESSGWAMELPAGTEIDGRSRRKAWAIRIDRAPE